MKKCFAVLLLSFQLFCSAQLSEIYFDTIDSLIEKTPEIELCQKDGKDDLRFMTRTPEKYSNYRQVFMQVADTLFSFASNSHFFCDVQGEVNCRGQAGNYSFLIEPRTFSEDDYQHFLRLIDLIEKLRLYEFIPAIYLGEKVNSKFKFRFMAKGGKPFMQ